MLSLNEKNVEDTETTRGQQNILVSDKWGRVESYRAFCSCLCCSLAEDPSFFCGKKSRKLEKGLLPLPLVNKKRTRER